MVVTYVISTIIAVICGLAVGYILMKYSGLPEGVIKVISYIVFFVLFVFLPSSSLFNPKPNYTGNPQNDVRILKERIVDYGYDFDAAFNELVEVYAEKGLGMQNIKDTMGEYAE